MSRKVMVLSWDRRLEPSGEYRNSPAPSYDRRRGQVDHALFGTDPAQLAIRDEVEPERAEVSLDVPEPPSERPRLHLDLSGGARQTEVVLDFSVAGEAYRVIAARRGIFVQPALFEAFENGRRDTSRVAMEAFCSKMMCRRGSLAPRVQSVSMASANMRAGGNSPVSAYAKGPSSQ